MKILLDECMPHALPAGVLPHCEVFHVKDMGWLRLRNGELLRTANEQFNVLLTIDKNMPYQQSLKGLSICVAVLDIREPSRETFHQFLIAFETQLSSFKPGTFNLITL